jgi:GT2 family glycosyltransferase
VSETPFVSVVVPTLPGRALLRDCLAALLAQTYPAERREIVVVSDGPGASLGGLEAPGLRLVARAHGGAGAARNTGLAQTSGDPVCFIDDDALPPPGWLAALVEGALRHPDAALVGGAVRPLYEARPPRTCSEHEPAGATLDEGPRDAGTDEVWGCNMALRRASFERLGGFDERLRYGEDWDYGRRVIEAGGQIVYLPDAWIEHRRLADDLRLRALPLEYLRRGWLVGSRLAEPPRPRDQAHVAWRQLRHAAGARCTRGLTEAAKASGLALAGLARALRGR